jgi:Zn-dependent protease
MHQAKAALYYLVGLTLAFMAHEYAQARAAKVLGDRSAESAGRLSLDPRRHFDPLGTGLLPGLLLLVAAAGVAFVPPFAYGRAMPMDGLRFDRRRYVQATLAGPAATLALAAALALFMRVVGPGELGSAIGHGLVVAVMMTVFQLMPLPPLDGSRVLARFLPPKGADFMDKAQDFGGIVMIVVFFVFGSPVFVVVDAIGNGLCRILVGVDCF